MPWTQQQKTTCKKYKQTQIQKHTVCSTNHGSSGWKTKKISTKVKQRLLEHTCGQVAWQYWENKMRFQGMDIQEIDWATIHKVVNGMTIKQQQWATKSTTSFCVTRRMMYHWGQRETAACLRCGYDNETTPHILQCPNPVAQSIVDQNTQDLRALLKELDTDPNTMEDLREGFYT